MNMKCIRYGNPAGIPIRALEVRTLHVRGLGGEQRVQALGNETESGVCERCAEGQLNLSLNPFLAARSSLISFGAVFAAGLAVIAVTFLLLKGEQVFLLLGIAALICGALGVADTLRKAKEKSASLRALHREEALAEAAWDIYLSEAPKKEDQKETGKKGKDGTKAVKAIEKDVSEDFVD